MCFYWIQPQRLFYGSIDSPLPTLLRACWCIISLPYTKLFRTRLILYERTTPQLAPPLPVMAHNVYPLIFSQELAINVHYFSIIIWSTVRPYFLIMLPEVHINIYIYIYRYYNHNILSIILNYINRQSFILLHLKCYVIYRSGFLSDSFIYVRPASPYVGPPTLPNHWYCP